MKEEDLSEEQKMLLKKYPGRYMPPNKNPNR